MDYEELITPKEARAILRVSNKTLWSWHKKGLIRAVRLPSGRLRYYKSDIEDIVRGKKRENLLEKIRNALMHEENVLIAYLYGSRARGDFQEESDVDVAVLVKDLPTTEKNPFYETELSLRLSKAVGKDVEVRLINGKPLIFLCQVLKHGKLIVSKDEKTRVKFEASTLDRCFDFRPILDSYNRMRERRLEAWK